MLLFISIEFRQTSLKLNEISIHIVNVNVNAIKRKQPCDIVVVIFCVEKVTAHICNALQPHTIHFIRNFLHIPSSPCRHKYDFNSDEGNFIETNMKNNYDRM